MTMILQLLVAAVAVGLVVDARLRAPPYKEYLQALKEVSETLETNVLSMEGNIPPLNDSRRHYVEIVNVVNFHGMMESGSKRVDYYESYPKFLNTSAPRAINHPEEVIHEIRSIEVEVHNNIDELKDLINACVQEWKVCNELIDDTVKANKDQYGFAAVVLITAGRAATEFNKLNEKFQKVSKDLKAHQYVCTSAGDLEKIVRLVADFYRVLRGNRGVDAAL